MRLTTNKYEPNNAYIWYDASDASTITIQTGVSQLNDKGTAGFNLAQSVASQQPVYNSIQQNGLPTISFDSASSNKLVYTADSINMDNMAFAIAFKPKEVNQYKAVFSYNGDWNDWQIDSGDVNNANWLGRMYSAFGTDMYDSAGSTNTSQVLSFVCDTTAGTLTGYKNGTHTFTNNSYTQWDKQTVVLRMGANRNNDVYSSLDFYELAVVPPNEIYKLNAYLVEKWGIV